MNQCPCPKASVDYHRCLARCRSPGLPSRPLPYIGLYIAMATLVCFFAVLTDLCHGLLHNEPWIPSEYFTMNVATLTLLAVVVKLPLDITTEMFSTADSAAKLGGLMALTVAMATFMPSLASMNQRDIWQNMVALGILIITLSVDCIIQMFTRMADPFTYTISLILLFSQFMFFMSTALSASAAKSSLELKYHKLHEQIPRVTLDEGKERLCVQSLRKRIQIYWIMTKTSNPVFVMARSVTCLTTSIMSCYAPLHYLCETFIGFSPELGRKGDTDYRWSIPIIQITQVLLCSGCVATLLLRSKFITFMFTKKTGISHFKHACRMEEYWTKGLKQLKHRPLVCRVANCTCRKIIEDVKMLVLNICITMQVLIVMMSKQAVLITYLVLRPLYFCFHHLRIKFCSSYNHIESDSGTATKLAELEGYVLLLEGESELPLSIMKGICTALDQVIQRGAKQQKKHLLELVSGQIFSLNSLLDFDKEEVESLHPEEPPRCWSLAIANLTSICFSISTSESDEKRKLLHRVDEGMSYICSIEKSLDSKKKLEHVGKEADVIWNGVALKSEWL